jgi:hypothetical protein
MKQVSRTNDFLTLMYVIILVTDVNNVDISMIFALYTILRAKHITIRKQLE